MSREDSQMKIRLPDELKERIESAALNGKRSLNAEIVARLEQTFAETSTDASLKALAMRLAETELDLRVSHLESDGRLLDAHYAAGAALDAIEFNKLMGYEQPLDAQTLKEVKDILRETQEILDDQSPEDFQNTIQQLKDAQKRLRELRPTPPGGRVRKRLITEDAPATQAPPAAPRRRVKLNKPDE